MKMSPLEDSPLVRAGLSVVTTLRGNGFNAVFAGGCVRDQIMGNSVKDFDIATDAAPKTIKKIFRRTVAIGAQFGVILVLVGKFKFEVATFRSDGGYSDGRHPDSVRFGTLEEDVLRRDFTINGLMYDPVENRLIDLVGGRKDIAARTIRAIGDPEKRFEEDKLRMLRAVRFAARFGFKIEKRTLAAVRTRASRITVVSAERIGEELAKSLTGENPDKALRLMSDTGLLAVLLPEIAALKSAEQDPKSHPEGDAFEHTVRVLADLPSNPSKTLAFAALLHDVGKGAGRSETGETGCIDHAEKGAEIADKICRRLRFSNKERGAAAFLVRTHSAPYGFDTLRKSVVKKIFQKADAGEFFALLKADISGGAGDMSVYHNARKLYEELAKEGIAPEPFVTGEDLKLIGVKPGPKIGGILNRIYDAQLDMEVTSRPEALELAKRLAMV
jgi:poly(A) polymerase